MLPYRVNDLRWGWNGDLAIGASGDLAQTEPNPLLSFLQEAKTRLQSDLYDWYAHPHLGASLSEIIGEPNSKETAETGRARIIASLTRDGFVAKNLIAVRYVPVSRHQILYIVNISLPGVTNNEVLQVSLLLNTQDCQLTFV